MNNLSEYRKKGIDPLREAATKSAPKPGDYPIGSLQSRAAARAFMGRRRSQETAIQVIYVSPDGARKNGPLFRFPAVELNPRQEATLRERMNAAKERMKEYRPQSSETETRVEYNRV
jgi:hypothetical protein